MFGRWVVDGSKSVLQGDNEAFPVPNNNKIGQKFRSNLPTGGAGEYIRALYRPEICWLQAKRGPGILFFFPFFLLFEIFSLFCCTVIFQ